MPSYNRKDAAVDAWRVTKDNHDEIIKATNGFAHRSAPDQLSLTIPNGLITLAAGDWVVKIGPKEYRVTSDEEFTRFYQEADKPPVQQEKTTGQSKGQDPAPDVTGPAPVEPSPKREMGPSVVEGPVTPVSKRERVENQPKAKPDGGTTQSRGGGSRPSRG